MPSPFSLKFEGQPDEDATSAGLRFRAITHSAGFSTLEEARLQLTSDRSDIRPQDLLGRHVEITIEIGLNAHRRICGHVTRFAITHHEGRAFGYQATVRPWLWFLTRTADCRVFERGLTVPDIVSKVFEDHQEIAHFELRLQRTYRPREYCVQYQETDFNFVARLLEDEGIYWYFEHQEGRHTLILADAPDAHQQGGGDSADDDGPDVRTLPYFDSDGGGLPDFEHIADWNCVYAVRPGQMVLGGYDFEQPGATLRPQSTLARDHHLDSLEVFDYLGEHIKAQHTDHADQLVRNRLHEQQARHVAYSGRAQLPDLLVGQRFELTLHPRDDQNATYLCTQATLLAQDHTGESGDAAAAADFQCSFSALVADVEFRPRRLTPKPFVQGPQTAVVVGSGEAGEIDTDAHGRVKVQFHWDRYGQHDADSSCWVRVAQQSAGQGWGSMQLPRIGQEVVVDFLEGDPDQPLITGRVYNADMTPPYPLPASASVSGIKTQTLGGEGFNELSFDDAKGHEKVTLHAQHDLSETVLNDHSSSVKKNRSTTVDSADSLTVGADRTMTVKGKLTESVEKGQAVTIKQGLEVDVDGGATHKIKGDLGEKVEGSWTNEITADHSEKVGGTQKYDVTADWKVEAGSLGKIHAGNTLDLGGATNLKLHAGSELKLAVGGSTIVLTETSITLTFGSSSVTLDAEGVAVAGSKISLNG